MEYTVATESSRIDGGDN